MRHPQTRKNKFQNYWRFLMLNVWLPATGNGRLEVLQCDRIGYEHFCLLLLTSMRHKQRIITREVGGSSDSESHFIIAAYCLQIKFPQVGDQLEEADTMKDRCGLCLEIKNQFLHLTLFFHSVSEINHRQFSAARQPRAALRFAKYSGFPELTMLLAALGKHCRFNILFPGPYSKAAEESQSDRQAS